MRQLLLTDKATQVSLCWPQGPPTGVKLKAQGASTLGHVCTAWVRKGFTVAMKRPTVPMWFSSSLEMAHACSVFFFAALEAAAVCFGGA